MSKQSMNFEGFLNGLQNWEQSLKDKDKKQDFNKGKKKLEVMNEDKQPVGKSKITYNNKLREYHSPMNYDPLSDLSSSFMPNDSSVDAVSEKDQGNDYFKQKKFNEAIDCYSRSIALSPTAVAYANRAMAYLKIRRYKEAESDCTEALNLDDRYIKAYSRRATARKELRKLRDSLEDVEFALRLEPQNEDLKKQRAEVKSLLEQAILAKAAGTASKAAPVVKEVGDKVVANGQEKHVLSSPEKTKKAGVDVRSKDIKLSMIKSADSRERVVKNKLSGDGNRQEVCGLHDSASGNSLLKNDKIGNKERATSLQDLASRAASRAMSEAANNISTPNSAYEFEVSWKGFSGDPSLQARLLKVTQPERLPQIFRNALTAPLLIDIVKCIATFFVEETELAVKYLQHLSKIPRFDMIIMCLHPEERAELRRMWDEIFLSNATPIEFMESLSELHPRYIPR